MATHRRAGRRSTASRRHRSIRRLGRAGVLVGALAVTTFVAGVSSGVVTSPVSLSPVSAEVPTDDTGDPGGSLKAMSRWADDPRSDDGGDDETVDSDAETDPSVPAGSGTGRRVVYDISEQRVWLVSGEKPSEAAPVPTYLVSGGVKDNLKTGNYRVYSRSIDAVSYDYESTMRYFVRFAHGKKAAIGFHDIPVDDAGQRLQDLDELGTRTSSGCIRQKLTDARRMWQFADLDTRVIVID